MSKFSRIIMFNQVTGPLFQELVSSLTKYYKNGGILVSGNFGNLKVISKLKIKKAPKYNRSNKFLKFISWIKYTFYALLFILSLKNDDIVLISSNPPILGFCFYPILRIKKIKYLILIYDIYPDVLISDKIFSLNNFLVKLWFKANNILYKNSELVLTIGESMLKNIKNKYKIDNISFLQPYVDTKSIRPLSYKENIFAPEYIDKEKFVIMYSGNMGYSHDMQTVLKAARLLKKNLKICFLFIGHGPGFDEVKKFIKKNNLKNIRLFPFQPEEKIKYTLPLASLSVVSVQDGFQDLLIPSKTFFYMSAGSALLSICSLKSDLAKLVKENKIGIVVEPGDFKTLAYEIERIMNDSEILNCMRFNARKLVIKKYSKEKVMNNLINLLDERELLGISKK